MADSNELLRRIARVGADIDPALSDRDVERPGRGGARRRQRRTVTRGGRGTLADRDRDARGRRRAARAAASRPAPRDVAVAGAPAPTAARGGGADPAPLRLADGSVATPLDEASALSVREDAPQRVAIDLVRGAAASTSRRDRSGRFRSAPAT
jgi:hypothetical protein